MSEGVTSSHAEGPRKKPNPECKICFGRGEFKEYHGSWASEVLLCECVLEEDCDPSDFGENPK